MSQKFMAYNLSRYAYYTVSYMYAGNKGELEEVEKKIAMNVK